MPRSSSMRSKSLRSSKRPHSRSDGTAPGAFASGARTGARSRSLRHRSPTRLFYAKHPEDDMTQLDIARQDIATLETAPTRYIEGNGIRFAYRRLGAATGTPL